MNAEQLYVLHYTAGNPGGALELYKQILLEHANTPEAGYSQSQIENIARTGSANHTDSAPISAQKTSVPSQKVSSGIIQCPVCSKEVSAQAAACVQCGHPISQAQSTQPQEDGNAGSGIAAICGGALLAVGPFLSWVTLGSFSASGTQKVGSEIFVLVVLGVLGIAVGLEAVVSKTPLKRSVVIIAGIIAGALQLFYVTQLVSQLERIPIGEPSLGTGVYVCILGILILIGSGFLSVKQK